MNTNINNCFQGSHALVDFLNPACRGALPLVELTDPTLNPFLNSNNRVRIFGCLGFMNPFLYQQALAAKPSFYNDIIQGTNNGYDAGKGWDPASGWGSVDGQKLLDAYKQAGK